MSSTPFNPSGRPYLERRAVVPTLLRRKAKGSRPDLPDLDSLQGDVYYMLPKKFERFLFFVIKDVATFWKDLDTYRPRTTSSAETARRIGMISENSSSVAFVSHGLAFSKAGLRTLGIMDDLQDPHFDAGSMRQEKDILGDKSTWNKVFDDANVHGVFVITAKTAIECQEEEGTVRSIFGASVSTFTSLDGRVRPGDGEHFGWRDGISQPAIKDLVSKVQPGQQIVDPGVIVMGYKGDAVFDNSSRVQRPAFTKDGSFMVFRKLEQDVLGFENYIDTNWSAIPAYYSNSDMLSDEERKELFGARIVGRFKTGAPLAKTPYKDDRSLLHPDKINDFNYKEGIDIDDPTLPPNCPFGAHIRKTAPRNLEPLVHQEYLNASMIIRAGIPYGPEISEAERTAWKPGDEQKVERGLLFVCYQSSIENGFFRQTTKFANNDYFPITDVIPRVHGPDPIIGGPKNSPNINSPVVITGEGEVSFKMVDQQSNKYVVHGFAQKVDTSAMAYEPQYFVTSRGGEYFFVPSINTLKDWCIDPPRKRS